MGPKFILGNAAGLL